jgi:predicted TIM-barrel fold metal-dependent hydrolase
MKKVKVRYSIVLFSTYLLWFSVFLFIGCAKDNYTIADFASTEKIDAHIHINTEKPFFLQQAQEDNFRVLSINTDVYYYPPIEKQQELALLQRENFPKQVQYATTFSLKRWDLPQWQEETIDYLAGSIKHGAIAVKVWKNIGMEFKDKDSNFVMIDHVQFDPIFDFLSNRNISVVGHIGEPKNCWLPIEQMTVNNDKDYFSKHPQYHMYLHPEYPSYDSLIGARDDMLEKHPQLRFIGCHLGSLEWNLDELAKRFETYPNFAVDLADRICHLQYQSRDDIDRVRNFLIKYQDRIIYGSDLNTDGTDNPEELKKRMHKKWLRAWQYFITDDKMIVPEVDGAFNGLALPKQVIDKIFSRNAENWYPGI